LKRAEIEADILAGELSIRGIAAKHGLSGHMGVARHKEHMAGFTPAGQEQVNASEEANKAALQVQPTAVAAFLGQEGIDLTEGTDEQRMRTLIKVATRVLNDALKWDSPTAHQSKIQGIKLAKDLITDAAKLRENLLKTNETRLAESPEWARTQARIVAALRPFPEALESVLQALDDEDAPEVEELAS
jgi:hypothetical protein